MIHYIIGMGSRKMPKLIETFLVEVKQIVAKANELQTSQKEVLEQISECAELLSSQNPRCNPIYLYSFVYEYRGICNVCSVYENKEVVTYKTALFKIARIDDTKVQI